MTELKCPLCESGEMKHKPVGNDDLQESERLDNYTHVWVCPHCPCVIFEFWENKDINNLKKILKVN